LPIGYGGVTPLFRQANTGINIFDPFRGAEAAYLWTQMLRAFHTLYGSRRFVINAYQFGAGNAEAIQSGAFWFYYRLGFRPAQMRVRTLAAREAARMASDRRYRSDVRTLKALATGDLYLDLPGFDPDDFFDDSVVAARGRLRGAPAGERARLAAHAGRSGAWPTPLPRSSASPISADGPRTSDADSNSWRLSSQVLAGWAAGAPPSEMR
jgi:hypothetical protein